MTDTISKVLEFHEAFRCAIGERPGLPDGPITKAVAHGTESLRWALFKFKKGAEIGDPVALRLALLTEELIELAQACDDDDLEGALDALVDLRYVLDGTVIAFGFHTPTAEHHNVTRFYRAFNRVHAANMAKLKPDGTVKRDATGKVVKPEGWMAPDLSDLVV